jgi:threonine aldolase
MDELRAIRAVADEHKLPLHIDGARLWNASVATGVSLSELASCGDTVMVAFSKGLGAPVGAALAGTRSHIETAWTARKLFGGAMRQSGMLAAGVLHALDHHMDRLADDHANAKTIAEIVGAAGGVRVVDPDTNIVMIDMPTGRTSAPIVAAAKAENIWISHWSDTRIRMVTHLDISADDARHAAEIVRDALDAA